jgi:hypothetical protein
MVAGGGLAARAVARRSTAIAMPVRGGRGSCTASGRWATLSAGMYDESGYIADYAQRVEQGEANQAEYALSQELRPRLGVVSLGTRTPTLFKATPMAYARSSCS